METVVRVKKHNHPTYTDEEIEALLNYFQCSDYELQPFLDKFD